MGKRQDLKEQRREELLSISLDLFVRKGYSGTTVRDITNAAGISEGLLFHYFPTKQAIFEELIDISNQSTGFVTEIFGTGLSPIQMFEAAGSAIFDNIVQDKQSLKFFLLVNQVITMESTPKEVRDKANIMQFIHASNKIIEEGQKAGEIRQGNPGTLSLAFWGAVHGIAEALAWYPELEAPDGRWLADILRA